MNEESLRALVRESIARHLGQSELARPDVLPPAMTRDASHYRFALQKTDGPCLIEPSVACNDCGYCESHGH